MMCLTASGRAYEELDDGQLQSEESPASKKGVVEFSQGDLSSHGASGGCQLGQLANPEKLDLSAFVSCCCAAVREGRAWIVDGAVWTRVARCWLLLQ